MVMDEHKVLCLEGVHGYITMYVHILGSAHVRKILFAGYYLSPPIKYHTVPPTLKLIHEIMMS